MYQCGTRGLANGKQRRRRVGQSVSGRQRIKQSESSSGFIGQRLSAHVRSNVPVRHNCAVIAPLIHYTRFLSVTFHILLQLILSRKKYMYLFFNGALDTDNTKNTAYQSPRHRCQKRTTTPNSPAIRKCFCRSSDVFN